MLAVLLVVAYVAAGYVWIHEQPAFVQRLLTLGFVVLATTTFLLATRPADMSGEMAMRMRYSQQTDFGKQLRAMRAQQHRTMKIPGLGEVGVRFMGAVGVFVVSGVWWLTPWAPVTVKPPILDDLTIPLGEDLVAAMLVLPNDHVAVVQPPVLPPRLRKLAKLIRDDASPYWLGIRAMLQGDFESARPLLASSLQTHDVDELQVRVTSAQLEMYAARFPDAIIQYDGALKLKPDQPMVLCQMAVARIQAGQFDKAIRTLDAAEKSCREKPGESQRALASCRHLRSLLAAARCKDFDEAIKLIEEGRQTAKKALGEEDLLVAANLNNQAALYVVRANFSGAQELFNFAQTIWTKTLGPQDPHDAAVRGNLALLNCAMGRYDKAEELLDQIESLPPEVLPADHPARIATLNLRGQLEHARGNYDRAQASSEAALGVAEKSLEPEHPCTAAVASDLADIYADEARHAKAYQYGFRGVSLARKLWGPEHPFLACDMNSLATICILREADAEADALCRQAQQVAERSYGKKHPSLAAVLRTRAKLETKDRPRNARKSLERAREIYEAVYGKEHPEVAITLGELAVLESGEPGIEMITRAIEMAEKFLGNEHPEVARLLCGMAAIYVQQEKYADAKTCLDRALAIERKKLFGNHPDLAATLDARANVIAKISSDDPEAAKDRAEAAGILAKHREEDRIETGKAP